ncbi:telomerase-binding protein EST1A isoform X2 [Syngnathoides biaculeatus]|uniref:telomerase-binding protein EST1A isoform X2 n=1 Tax=Syngnathoides biaculeatus TaxID=300417 RepID=UPI002ADD802F|nr:telomerase-binding protein EST1A isoform X2 [Syngnathoides biaculeatus]
MAEQLDRVRISAAELRVQSVAASTSTLDKENGHVPKKHGRHPDLERYRRGAGQGRQRSDSEEAESGPTPKNAPKNLVCTDKEMGGDDSNVPAVDIEAAREKDPPKNHQESQDPAGAVKPKKARKPTREFYQPGIRRNAQGKDCSGPREQDKPLSGSCERTADRDRRGDERAMKENADDGKCTRENTKSDEGNGNEGRQAQVKVAVEKLASRVEKLNVKEEASRGGGEDAAGRRGKRTHQERREEKTGNCRRRGGEKEKSHHVVAGPSQREKEGRDVDAVNKPGETRPNELRASRRRSADDDCKKNSGKADEGAPTRRSSQAAGQQSERRKSDGAAPASKRYSKSDIRRRRTYSSSSAGSVAAANGHGRPQSGTCGSRLRDRNPNGESSADSAEVSDAADSRRTDGACEGRDASRRRKGRGVSAQKKRGASGDRHKHGPAPRGRGGGILVLPAHSDISNPSEASQRMLFAGLRGGAASRVRGGRSGGARRLWDPNNPEQKPAPAPGGRRSLPQADYPQMGYGQLHFLDTDDEAAGSPPSSQRRTTASARYKFQNSDNPYCCPAPSGQRHPFASPYQTANGAYLTAQLHRGYPRPGGPLTVEEAAQQARGELGRVLRAADSQEVQLSNLLSRDRLSAEGLERMTQLRAELLAVYERVVLSDIELADSHGVDQALWKNVFYQVIERFRQLLKDPAAPDTPHIRNMLLTLLDEGAQFFDALLHKLQRVYQFKLDDYMDGMAIRARPLGKTVKYALISAQRCMICQGDIARYRQQASDSANYGKARSWYLKAQQIAPKNGRPYNQLALLAVYTKRKLDAVYYYMRSLAASNPILTAKESLTSLFEEAKRKTEQLERRRRQDERHGGSGGPAVRGRAGPEDGARSEVWVRPGGRSGAEAASARGTAGESAGDCELDAELDDLSASDISKRFSLSFLHAHGKLFTKVGMESFPRLAQRVLQQFAALLQHGPSLLGATQLLQIVTVNMFAVHNALSRDEGGGGGGESRSMLQEQSTALGLGMFALMVQRCTQILTDTPAAPASAAEQEDKDGELEALLRVSDFPADLRELLPAVKVWSDWMLGHPDRWNPPPRLIDVGPDVWRCLALLCNVLARVDHGEVPLYKMDTDEAEGDEELTVLQLDEDRLLAGFVPLLAAPQEPCYVDRHTDTAIAADCKRVTVLKYFLEALCGQEEPLLAFKGGKYVSVAPPPPSAASPDVGTGQDSLSDKEADDVIVESSMSASEGEEDEDAEGDGESDIRQLKARRHALANKLAQQQRRRDKIEAVLETTGRLQLVVQPLFLVPDTNGFIDHLVALKKLLHCGSYIVVVPLIVITELDGLAKGQDASGLGGGRGGGHVPAAAHVRNVQEKARRAVQFLEEAFEVREPRLRALTSRGSQLESIAFRSEDTSGQQGNNDDVILSCCLHYCQDKAKDFMPHQRNGTVRLHREVVLLTDDRNLRVKALTRNVPVRDIPAFLSWAKVG